MALNTPFFVLIKVTHTASPNLLNWQIDGCPWNCLGNHLHVNLRGEGVRRASGWDILIFSISRLSRQQAKSVCWWPGMNYETTHVGWEVALSSGRVATGVCPKWWGKVGCERVTMGMWHSDSGTSRGFPNSGIQKGKKEPQNRSCFLPGWWLRLPPSG